MLGLAKSWAAPSRVPPPVVLACIFAAETVLAPRLCAAAETAGAQISFNRDIRPILSDHCFQCHGPDSAQRKADLRLDAEAGAEADLGGHRAIVPGDVEASELVRRITAADPEERMPPAEFERPLSAEQIDLLEKWIAEGAKWQGHWSFIPPVRPQPPAVRDAAWPRGPIDAFVLARLEAEGLSPSPEADKTTLLRRVTFDLTGLPPAPAEVDAFLADDSPGAFERVVDRLLASPRYGERMAARWLDGARYADSNGYQSDGERFMWRWRDWVIDAYNRNLPFDQFTVEQLAGDLLPGCTLEQQIATGFNRNHRGNGEGGIIPAEYAVEYVVDRVDTTATVWLGLTMGCGRCHDHKFDPLTQREFYGLFAYFNNVPERGKAVKFGNSPPFISVPTPIERQELAALDRSLAAAEEEFQRAAAELPAAQTAWENDALRPPPRDWTIAEGLDARFAFDGQAQNLVAAGAHVKFVDGEPAFSHGRTGQAAEFDGQRFVDAGPTGDFGYLDKFSISAWINPAEANAGTAISRMKDVAEASGYYLQIVDGRVQLNLVMRWLDDCLRVETQRRLTPGEWRHVTAVYDGSRVAAGISIYIDGKLEPLKVVLDDLNQTFAVVEPLRIGGGGGPEGRFRGKLDDVRVYRRALSEEEAAIVAAAESIREILALPAAERSANQTRKLAAYFLTEAAPEPIRSAWRRVVELRARRKALVESFPTTMVMQEMPTPRETHVLLRGEYDKPGERVAPGLPASLPPLPAGAPNNRLGFARWLVDPANPLTARVAVNRYWQMFFGTGIVKTVDDFGSQGEAPSHPELLDWLATEYIAGGWDTKALLRAIVTSATYRQASGVTPELLRRDPENRLLARGPRVRLAAEMIRDQTLAASGLLVERIGGPSVKPYQPGDLWKELASVEYVQDHGEKLYRRSLYTFWKRTVAPPTMIAFDAAGRETCTVRETRTNTPLQALTLLNEVTFVEAARMLAQRVMLAGGETPESRLALGFRLAVARPPQPAELEILVKGFESHLARYRAEPQAAAELLSAGEAPRDERLDAAELAAYAAAASVILNLDETVTKE
ncbi:MAG TPA: DUF1553 domain-containing protein [Pirellulales bacterium]|nr:DUF1553 domain-containing protein [Pirellulales bacterium]